MVVEFFKNLFLLPRRVKKISTVTHNSKKQLDDISKENKEMLNELLEFKRVNIKTRKKTKKVLILGTSNSLFKGGWVTGLAHGFQGYQIKNVSVGASQGFQFSGIVASENFSQYDYVFFDSVPNEESYYLGIEAKKYNYGEKEERLLYELLSTISSQTNLIVMGFCNNYAFEKESEIFKSRREITQNVGGYFFDIRKILKLHMKIKNLTVHEIYESTSHPKREISCEIGRYLGNLLQSKELFKNKYPKNYSTNFYCESIDLKSKKKQYENSVMSLDVSSVSKEDTINIKNDLRCVGLYMNAIKTNCYIECSYKDENIQQVSLLYTVYNDHAENFQKIFVGLQGFPMLDSLKIVSSESDFKNLYFPLLTHKEKLQASDTLELSEVMYWNDRNLRDQYDKDIFSYDESMLLTYKVIDLIVG